MKRHAAVVGPRFALVEQKLTEGLGALRCATWTHPKGGYFISFDGPEGSAKAIVKLAADLGVKMTPAGATWPYGNDPHAFANLVELDQDLADAGESRQYIDLIWGATLTRYLTTARFSGLGNTRSAGRVQTPTLALVVEKERERMCAICADGGDGSCDECIRVAHRTHPDVRWLAPGSVTGYLVDQVRDVIADASLSPARATRKVYIVERAELLRGAAANALLKTIEEPPSDVIFVLMARAEETVLPTIVSRCQVVRFQVIAPDVALAELVRSGATEREARIALSVAGTPMAERSLDVRTQNGKQL